MSTQRSDPPPASAKPKVRRGKLWFLLVLPVFALSAASLVYWFWPSPVVAPPRISTAGLEPEVAASIEDALQNVRDKPRSGAAWGELGTVLFACDMYVDANPCLEQAEVLDRANVRWPYLRGLALSEYDPPGALNCLRRAAGLASNDFGPHLRLAEALLQQEQLDEAEKEFRRTLELQPGNQRAMLGLGRAALSRGALEESLGHLLLMADTPISRRAVNAALAEVYRRQGDTEAATRHEARVRTLPADAPWPDPLLSEAKTRAVSTARKLEQAHELWQAGDIPSSLALLEEVLLKKPHDAESLALLGAVRFSQQNASAAEAALREAVRLRPEDSNSQLLLGALFLQQKRVTQAAEVFRQVLKARPTSSDAAYNLSQCLVQQGDRAGAIEVLRTALRYRPEAAPLHIEFGKQLLQDGKPAKALPVLQQAVLLAPSDAQAQQLLEEARRLAGRTP